VQRVFVGARERGEAAMFVRVIDILQSVQSNLNLPFAFVLVGLEILFLHHMSARTSLIATSMRVLCSHPFFNIKSADKTSHSELLSLVF
jgi:hypothetical protein